MSNNFNNFGDTVEEAENRDSENPTLGKHNGYEFNMAIRREPDGAKYPDEFAVNVYLPRDGHENVDIVRVDTAHGITHVDRLYLPDGHDRRKHDPINIEQPEEAVVYFTEDGRWRDWVDRFESNHGLP